MRFVRWAIVMVAAAAICWRFPLFQVVPLKTARAEKQAETFNATQFADRFWTNELLAGLDKTVPAEVLVPAVAADPAMAKQKYGRSVGLSDAYFYFVSGRGRVVDVSDDEILLGVTAGSTNADISLQAGLIFGNAVRDGTGLLNASDYPNSQDFNGISAALNHIVETRVLPELHADVKIGAIISFAGCAEVDDESSDLKPLKVIPIEIRMQ